MVRKTRLGRGLLVTRLLNPRIKGGQAAGAGYKADDWNSRIAKFIPIEVAGPFTILDNIVRGGMNPSGLLFGVAASYVMIGIFLVLLACSIVYLRRGYRGQPPARKKLEIWHIAFCCGAFLLWTYVSNSVMWAGLYHPVAAPILAILFGVVAGAFFDPEVPANEGAALLPQPPAAPAADTPQA